MNIDFIDLKVQYEDLKEDIQRRLDNVMSHGQFIMGPEVSACEEALCRFTNSEFALTCSSGTDALLIAMMALDIGPGDEVITSPFTFVANAEMIVLLGATPVLVDIEKDTYNIDATLIEEMITPRTKAIMPVGLYGQVADMDPINSLAERTGIPVIEDAAQSFGALYNGKRSCSLSDVGCTSFFPAKPLGCYGDGGAVFTNDSILMEKMNQIRTHGQEARYQHRRLGINGRLDTMQCAILLSKLSRFPREIEMRQLVAKRYDMGLREFSDRIQMPVIRDNRTSVYAQYTIQVDERERFQTFLKSKGIPTAIHYPMGIHQQQAYREKVKFKELPVTERAKDRVVSLPMYPDMKAETQDYIIGTIASYFKGSKGI